MPTIRTYIDALRARAVGNYRSLEGKREDGFSLIEILVVLILIAIMAAIVASNWRTPSETIDKKAAVSVTMDYKAAIDEYRQDHHGEAPSPNCSAQDKGAWQAAPNGACDGSLNAGPLSERRQ